MKKFYSLSGKKKCLKGKTKTSMCDTEEVLIFQIITLELLTWPDSAFKYPTYCVCHKLY